MSFPSAFLPSLPVSAPRPSLPSMSPRNPPKAQISTVSDNQLKHLASTSPVLVVKCYAAYCTSCRGVEPKFRKIAAAYDDQPDACISFAQIDYARYEPFCRDTLGVHSLPFFGIWIDGQYAGGEAMGWRNVRKKLCNKIDTVLENVKTESEVTHKAVVSV